MSDLPRHDGPSLEGVPLLRRGRPEAHVHHSAKEAAGDNAVLRGKKKDEEVQVDVKGGSCETYRFP